MPSNTERAAIDHHRSHIPYAEHTYVDAEAPATGEILADLIRGMDWPLTREEAWSLWAAISTDTGSFQYPATTAHTLEVAAALVHAGADPGALSQSLYQSFPERRLRLLQRLLNTLDLRADGRIASWRLRQSDLQELRIQPGDTEGLIDHLRAIEGVVVAISFEERGDQDDTIRVSARSKDATVADVSQLCEAFGGGGHRLAAGAALPGPLDQAAETFLERINQSLNHGSDH
ncbi:MAG: DHHA1 domain-containing protein [Verrucomicrobiota bacterium]